MAAPTVSVIIPTYNRAHLIRQAIDSVFGQTFTDHEIIVVDDGSTDDTRAVVGSYGDRVTYISIRHGGIAGARNAGMAGARGRYLTFLDSDDVLYPYALELEVRLLERFPALAMVCAEMTGFDDQGWSERYHLRNYHRSSFRDPAVTFDAIYATSAPLAETCDVPATLLRDDPDAGGRRVYRGNIFDTYLLRLVICQNTAMIRREVVAALGPRREHIFTYQEYDYLLRLARHHEILFVDVPTYRLRYHYWQISSTARSDGHLVWIRKQRSLLRVFRRHALADPDYYRRHRAVLDRQMAHLYRGVAVPTLLLGGKRTAGRSYARNAKYARMCLARCRQYGHPAPALEAASVLPGPLRRLLVGMIEGIRRDGAASLVRRAIARIVRSVWA